MTRKSAATLGIIGAGRQARTQVQAIEAVRAAGIEVWFDQNELGGGDAWDAKIRTRWTPDALRVVWPATRPREIPSRRQSRTNAP